MKLSPTLLALALTLNLSVAQTDSTTTAAAPPATAPAASTPTNAAPAPAAPQVRKKTTPGSVTPKAPPTAPDSKGGGWEKRANDTTAKAAALGDKVQLVFDGDSITDFWQSRGAKIWQERYAKYVAFDFAISGDTTQNVLWRLANGQGKGLHPKLIFLMIGTNNMKETSSPQDIVNGVQAIIAEYQKLSPETVIALQAIFPRGPEATDPYRLKVKATNEILAKLADGTKVIYLDFGDKFLSPDGKLDKAIMPDYLHPSEQGYQIWADAIQPTVDKYLGAGAAK